MGDELNLLAEMGLKHSDDVYRGRDGRHYQMTDAAREAPEMTELRRHYLLREPVTGGSTWVAVERTAEKALKPALEWMAKDDQADDRAPANENRSGAAAKPVPPAGPVPYGPALFGRGPANDNRTAKPTEARADSAQPVMAPASGSGVGPRRPDAPSVPEAASTPQAEERDSARKKQPGIDRFAHMAQAMSEAESWDDEARLLISGATLGE